MTRPGSPPEPRPRLITTASRASLVTEDPLLLAVRSATGKTFLLMHRMSVDCNHIPWQTFLSNHVTKRCGKPLSPRRIVNGSCCM